MEEEKKPRTVLKTIMIVLSSIIGTILILLIIGFTWLMVKNPLNVRAILLNYLGLKQIEVPIQITPAANAIDNTGSAIPAPSAPTANIPISDSQRQALEEAGIDPNAIQITPELEACAREKLGNERVEEIINGAAPGPLDLFRAGSCF